MSELSLNPQQLTQALQQLAKAQVSSPLAQQASQIIIKHLAGNALSIGVPRQPQTVNLPRPAAMPANFPAGAYQAQLVAASVPVPQLANNPTAVLNLFEPKASTIAPTTLATLNKQQTTGLLNAASQTLSPSAASQAQVVPAKVVSLSANTVTLSAQIDGQSQPISLRLRQTSNLSVSQNVQLQIVPQAKGWQLNLQLSPTPPANQSAAQQSSPKPPGQSPVLIPVTPAEPKTLAKLLHSGIPLEQTLLPAPQQTVQQVSIARQTLHAISQTQPQLLPAKLLLELPKLGALADQLQLVISANGRAQIQAQPQQPLLTFGLDKQQAAQLQQLLRPSTTSTPNPATSGTPNERPLPAQSGSTPQPVITPQGQAAAQSQAAVAAQSQATVAVDKPIALETTSTAIKIWQALPSEQKSAIQGQIQELLRRVVPQSDHPANAVLQIEKALTDPAFAKHPASKEVLSVLLNTLQSGMLQGKDTDAAQLKQLLTQPALNLTPASITQPASQTGLLSGLLTLLQVSLASRLARNQSVGQERVAQLVTGLLGNLTKPGTTATTQMPRALNDMLQMDQKHQLVKQLSRLFSSHQASKLGSVEQALQGQENMHYVLPTGTTDNPKEIELLIRRDQHKGNAPAQTESKTATWHLTMKMDIGDIGQLLSKAKLVEHTLELDFYTSNDTVKQLIFEYLPLFKQRLAQFDIEVSRSQCQLGKIPEQLQARPYHMFETRV